MDYHKSMMALAADWAKEDKFSLLQTALFIVASMLASEKAMSPDEAEEICYAIFSHYYMQTKKNATPTNVVRGNDTVH